MEDNVDNMMTFANLALGVLALMVSFSVPLFGVALWVGRTAHSMDSKLDRIIQLLNK